MQTILCFGIYFSKHGFYALGYTFKEFMPLNSLSNQMSTNEYSSVLRRNTHAKHWYLFEVCLITRPH